MFPSAFICCSWYRLLFFVCLSTSSIRIDCHSGATTLSAARLEHPSIFIELWSTGHNDFFWFIRATCACCACWVASEHPAVNISRGLSCSHCSNFWLLTNTCCARFPFNSSGDHLIFLCTPGRDTGRTIIFEVPSWQRCWSSRRHPCSYDVTYM